MSAAARSSSASDGAAAPGAEIRRAATVVVGRDGPEGLEVVLLRRSPASRFLAGYAVFPGGALEPEDDTRAEAWFGSAEEAPRAGAVRELAEEAGLVLTRDELAPAAEGGLDAALASVDADPPPADRLRRIARWVAPEQVPVRFDAHFFALEAPLGLEPTPDGREADRAWWARPADVMADWAAERTRLYWPTMKTMEALARCGSVAELLAVEIPQREPGPEDLGRMPRSTFYEDG